MKKYLAEFIGTFGLVFFGTGSVIINTYFGEALGLLGISLVFGIAVSAMIYIFGGISGAHINPAVTISLMMGKLFNFKEGIFYIISQTLGAFFASFVLMNIFPIAKILGETTPTGNFLQSFLVEIITTFFLMLTILGTTSTKSKETKALAGLIIGLMVAVLILFSGPISGGSFNPARSLAPALLSGNLVGLWIYLTGPTIGAILAVFTWKKLN